MIKLDMNQLIDPVVCRIPDYAAPYLVNGDASGLSEEDIEAIDKWAESMNEDGYSVTEWCEVVEDDDGEWCINDEGAEPYFSSSPEFGLPCGVYDVLYHKGLKN